MSRSPLGLHWGASGVRATALLSVAFLTLALALAARAEALVYWANQGRNTIMRASLGGAGPHTLISGANNPCGVAVNSTHVFWVNRGDPSAVSVSHIGRARLDGTGVDQRFIPNAGVEGCGVAVNSTHIFWGAGSTVGRANLNGTGADNDFIGEQGSHVCGVGVGGGYLYWANETSNRIGRATINGTLPNSSYLTNVGIPCGVAVAYPIVYWANQVGSIGRGTSITQENSFIDLVPSFGSPCGVAVNTTHIFWADDAVIGRANRDDGSGLNPSFIRDQTASDPAASCGVAVDGLPVPAGTVKLGKAKLNKKKGTAVLTVATSWPGAVIATGRGVKKASRRASGVGKVKLPIRARGKAKRKLERTGRVRLRVKVTHRPAGGKATTRVKRIRLLKRR